MKNTLKNMRKRLGMNGDWELREEAIVVTTILAGLVMIALIFIGD